MNQAGSQPVAHRSDPRQQIVKPGALRKRRGVGLCPAYPIPENSIDKCTYSIEANAPGHGWAV